MRIRLTKIEKERIRLAARRKVATASRLELEALALPTVRQQLETKEFLRKVDHHLSLLEDK